MVVERQTICRKRALGAAWAKPNQDNPAVGGKLESAKNTKIVGTKLRSI
jgi:hypothetical protein